MNYSSLQIYVTSTPNHSYPDLCNAELTMFDKERNKFVTAPIKNETLKASRQQKYVIQGTLYLLNFLSQLGFKLVCSEKEENVEMDKMLSVRSYYLEAPPYDDVFELLHRLCEI